VAIPLPTVREQSIAGFFKVDLVSNVLGDDARGSFQEAWQAEKMQAAGLPEFHPVQSNVAVSGRGVLRGIHAEPWDKYVHVVEGAALGAWVDLRPGSKTFKEVLTLELTPDVAVYVPRGVGNSYLVTSERVIYTYLVNAHWRPDLTYPAVAYDDPELGITWPLSGEELIISDKDRANPSLAEAVEKLS
jgi:dTDP-4-dehydrorhamnose 3,5-epimerase